MPNRVRATMGKALAIGIALGISLVCRGEEPVTPERAIRLALEEVVKAVEAGEVGRVRGFISKRYRDERGYDRRSLGAYLALHIAKHEPVHVWMRVRDVAILDERSARVSLVAGLASSRIEALADLEGLRASVYGIQLDLEEEGDEEWKLVRAAWAETRAADLL